MDDNNNELDGQTTPQYVLTITVSDGLLTDTVDITVDIIEVNNPPQFTNLPDTVNVREDSTTINVIKTVNADDQDADVITYSMTSSPPTTIFSIDAQGKLTPS